MIDLKLDQSTKDLVFENNDLVLVDGAERVRQHLEIRLKLWRGEWYTDTDFGTPYLEEILGKSVTLSGAIAALKTEILSVDGVQSIASFEYTFNRKTRLLDVTFEAQTPYGIVKYA